MAKDTSGINHKAPGSLEALPNTYVRLGVLTSDTTPVVKFGVACHRTPNDRANASKQITVVFTHK